jgi:hypothetical protein
LAKMHCLRFFGNPATLTFGLVLWRRRKFYFPYGYFSIRHGSEIRFWKDKWPGNTPLREKYPTLYYILRHKSDTLAKVLESSPPNVSLRRSFLGPRQALWNDLLQRLDSINLTQGSDVFHQNLTENGTFSVASMYNALIQPDVPVDNNKKI